MKLNELMSLKDGIFSEIEDAGGEITESQEEAIRKLSEDLLAKVDNYGYFIVELQKKIEGLKEFKSAIDVKKKAAENYLNRIKHHVGYLLTERGMPSIKGNVVTVKNISKGEAVFDPETCDGNCIYQVVLICQVPEEVEELQSVFSVESVKKIPNPNSEYPVNMKYNVSFLNLKKLDASGKE